MWGEGVGGGEAGEGGALLEFSTLRLNSLHPHTCSSTVNYKLSSSFWFLRNMICASMAFSSLKHFSPFT